MATAPAPPALIPPSPPSTPGPEKLLEQGRRFLREAYVANSVVHPAGVRIEDDDITEDGCVCLVMERLEGDTLVTSLDTRGLRYPIAVDPLFSTAAPLGTARASLTRCSA